MITKSFYSIYFYNNILQKQKLTTKNLRLKTNKIKNFCDLSLLTKYESLPQALNLFMNFKKN